MITVISIYVMGYLSFMLFQWWLNQRWNKDYRQAFAYPASFLWSASWAIIWPLMFPVALIIEVLQWLSTQRPRAMWWEKQRLYKENK